jgi:hypothetical protein
MGYNNPHLPETDWYCKPEEHRTNARYTDLRNDPMSYTPSHTRHSDHQCRSDDAFEDAFTNNTQAYHAPEIPGLKFETLEEAQAYEEEKKMKEEEKSVKKEPHGGHCY